MKTFHRYKYSKLLAALLIVAFFISCSEKYHDLELPDFEPKLVVNSFFREGKPFRVSVSNSQGRNNTNKLFPVVGAQVDLYEDNIWVEALEGSRDPEIAGGDSIWKWFFYSCEVLPREGHTYRLEVSAEGFASVTAESTIPPRTELEIIDTSWIKRDYDKFLKVDLEMENPDDKRWFQLIVSNLSYILEFDSLQNDVIVGYKDHGTTFDINDPVIGLREQRLNEDYLVFSNELMSEKIHPFSVEISRSKIIYEMVGIDLVTLSDEAYKYMVTLTDFKNNDMRYSEPVKIFTNVNGGYGIFAGINVECDTINLFNQLY
ncbi:MAG: DUF4249 domain-containing protein [Prolixibacteraceae bacterium]|nr:DUF4249 domain-containing protein [Prolixibacteraceae bacterium]